MIPPSAIKGIAQCAKLLAVMRTPGNQLIGTPPQPESPHRANAVLYNLARGRALVYGRTELSLEELPMIAQVALSSIPVHRTAVLVAMARNNGEPLCVKQVEEATGVSRHTAEMYMEEMDWLRVMKFDKEGVGKPSQLSIRPEWDWCMSASFAPLLLWIDLATIGG